MFHLLFTEYSTHSRGSKVPVPEAKKALCGKPREASLEA